MKLKDIKYENDEKDESHTHGNEMENGENENENVSYDSWRLIRYVSCKV